MDEPNRYAAAMPVPMKALINAARQNVAEREGIPASDVQVEVVDGRIVARPFPTKAAPVEINITKSLTD